MGSAVTLGVGVRTGLNSRMPREQEGAGEQAGVGGPHVWSEVAWCCTKQILVGHLTQPRPVVSDRKLTP